MPSLRINPKQSAKFHTTSLSLHVSVQLSIRRLSNHHHYALVCRVGGNTYRKDLPSYMALSRLHPPLYLRFPNHTSKYLQQAPHLAIRFLAVESSNRFPTQKHSQALKKKSDCTRKCPRPTQTIPRARTQPASTLCRPRGPHLQPPQGSVSTT